VTLPSAAQQRVSPPRLRFRLPLDPPRLLRARERVRDYLFQHRLSDDAVDSAVLALEEAWTNAVRHSGATDDMEIVVCFDGTDLVAEVRDKGSGFDVASFDPHAPPDPLATCGRGLFLMASLMDELELRSEDGLHVRMALRGALTDGHDRPAGHGHHEESPAAAVHRIGRERALLDEIDEGFAAIDWEYRLTHVNARGLAMLGRQAEEVVGRSVWEILPRAAGTPVERACIAAMELGVPAILEHEASWGVWFELRIYPTAGGISVYTRDIAERKRVEAEREQLVAELRESRRRAEFVAKTTASLLSALDPQELVDGLCREVMERLDCDVCFNFLVNEEADALELNACAGVPPDEVERMRWLQYGEAVCGCAALEAQRIVAEDILHSDDPRTDLVKAYGVQAYACHPLMVAGRVLGTLSFGARDRAHFSDRDLSLMSTVADQVAIALARAQSEAALRESERRYRELFASMDEGFALHEMLYDEAGEPVDYRFLEVNPAFGRLTGLEPEALIGKTVKEVLPGVEPEWIERYGRVVRSGRGERFHSGSAELGRVYEGYAYPAGKDRFAVAFNDVTQRTLADDERRQIIEQLRAIIESTDTCIALLDRDFDFLLVNPAYAASCGYRPEEMIGLNHFVLFPHEENEAIFRNVRDTGKPVEHKAKPFEYPDQPERGVTYWDWRLAPVKDHFGDVTGLVLSLVDVTARIREVQRRDALAAINAAVAARLDADHILTRVLELAGEALLCQSGRVVLYENGDWRQVHSWGAGGGVLAWREQHSRLAELALAEQHPVLMGEGVLGIPLLVNGQGIGCLVFSRQRPKTYDEAGVDFAQKVGAVVSQALENAWLLRDFKRIATTLQEYLIHPLPDVPELEMWREEAWATEPERIGGDFSDVALVDDRRVAVLIGDVEGKGVHAAGLTETVHSAVSAFALIDPSPAFILTKTNDLLLRRPVGDIQFVTAFLVVLDLETGEARYASAGHLPPVLLSGGTCVPVPVEHGLPLGTFHAEYVEGSRFLHPEDTLVLFTDGVTDARAGGRLFGEEGVHKVLCAGPDADPRAVAKRLRDAAIGFADSLRDDLHILTVRLTGRRVDGQVRVSDEGVAAARSVD
jgi:PAS domain S-box-containing protein